LSRFVKWFIGFYSARQRNSNLVAGVVLQTAVAWTRAAELSHWCHEVLIQLVRYKTQNAPVSQKTGPENKVTLSHCVSLW